MSNNDPKYLEYLKTLAEYGSLLDASKILTPEDQEMIQALETEAGWIALAQGVKSQPDLQLAKIDCRYLFRKWYGNDALNLDKLMAKLERYL